MPVYTPYPGPGRGISTAGLNKNSGWKADVISQSGLNKQAGKSLSGLDTSFNPVVTSQSLSAVTGTTTTVNWTTQVGAPLGSITYQKADKSAAAVTVAETGSPPLTAHAIALTGLTAATYYVYTVTQPGAAGTGGKTTFSGRFGTTGTVTPTEQMSSPLDGVQSAPAPAPTAEETGSAAGLGVSAVEITATGPDSITVSWRTDAYADGQVDWDGGGQQGEVSEAGNKRMNHQVVLTGLQADTEYSLNITSQDAAGDEGSAQTTARTTAS